VTPVPARVGGACDAGSIKKRLDRFGRDFGVTEDVVIHHVSVGTNDVERSRRFYDAVLPGLGILPLSHDKAGLGYYCGTFHFSVQVPIDGHPASAGNGSHVAFAVEDRSMVDRFHEAALANGGTDDGAPGLRADYDAQYYAAFVRDPDGHKIEAVTYNSR